MRIQRLGSLALALVALGGAPACETRGDVRSEGTKPDAGPRLGADKGTERQALQITGSVRQATSLTLSDLLRLDPAQVRLNDVRRDGVFRGVFDLRGAPLRTLLEQAKVVKRTETFERELDLAIVARGREGRPVVISWGEVFYRNPAEIVVAGAGAPKMPHKLCSECHEPETFRSRLDQLERRIDFPKLVVASDFYADRSLEELVSLEVVDLGAEVGVHLAKALRRPELSAKEIQLAGPGLEPAVVRSLDPYTRTEADAILVGEGTGFHGLRRASGVPLYQVLADAKISFDPATGFLLSAADGYRVFLSSAEVFDPARRNRVLLCDRMDGVPVKHGTFQLVLLDDHAADRWIKGVARIDVVRAKP